MKVYKFYADWCQPCKLLSKQIQDNPDIEKIITPIDCADDKDEICEKYKIISIPTIVITKDNGEMISKLISPTINNLKDTLQKYKIIK